MPKGLFSPHIGTLLTSRTVAVCPLIVICSNSVLFLLDLKEFSEHYDRFCVQFIP